MTPPSPRPYTIPSLPHPPPHPTPRPLPLPRSYRRIRVAATYAVELGLQTLNMAAWLASNAWSASEACPTPATTRAAAGANFVMWTCWNAVGRRPCCAVLCCAPAVAPASPALRCPCRAPC